MEQMMAEFIELERENVDVPRRFVAIAEGCLDVLRRMEERRNE